MEFIILGYTCNIYFYLYSIMPRKPKESLAEIAVLPNEEPDLEVNHSQNDKEPDELQAPKEEDQPILPVKKPRPPKTQKQLDAWQITKEKGIVATKLRKQLADEAKLVKKEEKEERIVKTALVIKRKEMKRNRILENISDGEDDIPKKVKKVVIKEPEHQFVFV